MTIPESQLKTWSAQGSVQQSKATYATVKGVLENYKAPYANRSYATFLQGSYGNDTNIYADSDVDIVMRLDSIYQFDTTQLSKIEEASFHAATSPGTYTLAEFKKEVTEWLSKPENFGPSVKEGNKAIFIKGNNSRRDADVLVAVQFRSYTRFTSANSQSYHDGICFYLRDGTRIVNYPNQHSDNCTAKHQATHNWFKPTVRVFKNMRNRMIDNGILQEGVAPSYYIEGLLYNVPVEKFGISYQDTFVNCFNWIVNADQTELVCANGLHYLVCDGFHTSWSTANFGSYLTATRTLWNNWG